MSEQTFKVGDRVTVFKTSHGEVTYGPVPSTFGRAKMYAVQIDGGIEQMYQGGDLNAEPPAFIVGDVVTLRTSGSRATVEYGPYGVNGDIYIVKLVEPPADSDNPREFSALVNVMTKVPALVPVGTRVRIGRAKWAEGSHGEIGVVQSNTETWRADRGDVHPYIVRLDGGGLPYVAELTPVDDEPADTFEHNGTVYDLSAKYEDRDGDVWRFARVGGDVRGEYEPENTIDSDSADLSFVARMYGPLKKI
ncbi:phiSA1p31-related protein [Streptomyces sp. NPDC127061]|uniref:phiSA1p31-related protein n=1 Tax=Streptomyces sp. NPDC127061 TaxID=3347122 RepID=UPI00364EB7FB